MKWVNAIQDGMTMGATVAACIAILGIMTDIVSFTGIGLKLPMWIRDISGSNFNLALLLIAAVSYILGLPLLSLAVYVMVAVLCAPVLTSMGVGVLQAHLFVYYYAIVAQITPPVATAALVAAPLAGGTYVKTSNLAMKAGIGLLVIPFFFIWAPGLLLIVPAAGNWYMIPLSIIFCLLMMACLEIALNFHYMTKIRSFEWVLNLLSMVFIVMGFVFNLYFLVLAAVLFVVITITQMKFRKTQTDLAVYP
jgi:TRAP-type uncharacterized transport system fused permease subunit